MSLIIVTKFTAKSETFDALIASFDAFMNTPGLLRFDAFKDAKDTSSVLCIEEWDAQESIDAFMKTTTQDDMDEWMSMLAVPPQSLGEYRRL